MQITILYLQNKFHVKGRSCKDFLRTIGAGGGAKVPLLFHHRQTPDAKFNRIDIRFTLSREQDKSVNFSI